MIYYIMYDIKHNTFSRGLRQPITILHQILELLSEAFSMEQVVVCKMFIIFSCYLNRTSYFIQHLFLSDDPFCALLVCTQSSDSQWNQTFYGSPFPILTVQLPNSLWATLHMNPCTTLLLNNTCVIYLCFVLKTITFIWLLARNFV